MRDEDSPAFRLRWRLLWLISFRAAIVTLLLGGGVLAQIARRYIAQALERTGARRVKAAELLGKSFRSSRYYVKQYGLG